MCKGIDVDVVVKGQTPMRRSNPVRTMLAAWAVVTAGLMVTAPAYAQTCTPYQPVINSQLDGTASGHAGGGNTTGWTASGSGTNGWQRNTANNLMLIDDNGGATVTVPTTPADTLDQPISGVAPSSAINLLMSWGNGNVLGALNNGTQVRVQLIYGGVVYAEFLTSAYVPGGSFPAPPFPTAGASATALNGATLTTTSGNWSTPFTGTNFVITLPASIPSSGTLTLSAQRMDNGSTAGDDVYLNEVSVDTTTLCLRKITEVGTGTFGFTTGAAYDSQISTAGVQNTASITTTVQGTPAVYDASTTLAGVQPMVVVTPGVPSTITETTLPTGHQLVGASCTNGVTASVSGAIATIGAIPARTQATCTLTNRFVPPPPPTLGSCPANAFITRGVTGSTVRLYTLGLADGSMTDQGTSPAMENSINGIGFRQQDGYIWGWNNVTNLLVRVGAGGVADSPYPTPPTGLPAGIDFYTADVSSAGIYVGMETNRLWSIDVTTNTVVGGPITLGASIGTDMAFNPLDGNLYSVRSADGEVLRINPTTGAVTPIGISLPIGGSGGFGAVFFDNQGTLYAYKSDSTAGPGVIYRVFNPNGSGTLAYDVLATSLTASSLDGARCPLAPPQGAPAILLRKITLGSAGGAGPFNFTLNNTVQTTGTATTTAVNTPVQVDGNPGTAGLQPFTVLNASLGQPLTITESSLPAGWNLSAAACRRNGTAVGALSGTTYTIPGGSVVTGALFECDFTNTLAPQLTLAKTWVNATVNDAVTVSASGTPPPVGGASLNAVANTASETDTGTVLYSLAAGQTYTVSEAFTVGTAAGYVSGLVCTGNTGTGAALNYTAGANSGTITVGATATAITCTFTNTSRLAEMQIVKTGTPATVPTGGLVDYVLTVTNSGSGPITGAQVYDAPPAGLNCTEAGLAAPTCSACTGAVTAAALTTPPGVTLTTLAPAATATITLQCRATASGQ